MYDSDAMDRVVAELGRRPVDGDPEAVRSYASTCTGVASVIDGLLPGLDAIARTSQDQQSEAVVELCQLADRVTSRLVKVKERYGTMGSSLAGYAEVLDGACTQSWQACSDAQTALSTLDIHKGQLSTLKSDRRAADTGADLSLQGSSLPLHVHLRSGLRYDANDTLQVAKIGQIDDDYGTIDAARQSMTSAWETLESAAGTVVAALKALHDDGLDDGLRENASKVGHALHLDDLRTWLADHLDDIATVLGVAALLLCWVPVVGQVLAVAAAIASLAVLAQSVVDLCQDGATAAEWQAAGIAALGVLSFGVGRVAGAGIKIAGRASAASRAGASAGSKLGSVADDAAAARSIVRLGPPPSSARELLSSLNPRNIAAEYVENIQIEKMLWKDPKTTHWQDIATTFKESSAFTRTYAPGELGSGAQMAATQLELADRALLAYDVSVMVDG